MYSGSLAIIKKPSTIQTKNVLCVVEKIGLPDEDNDIFIDIIYFRKEEQRHVKNSVYKWRLNAI